MRHPLVALAFWNPGDPGAPELDALLTDPGSPLAKHGLTGIAETYASSTGSAIHHVHAAWAAEMAIKSLGVDGALCEVAPALRGAGIPFFVAKGPAIAYRDYPDARMRPYTDLDVYVPKGAATTARHVLAALGYEKVAQVTGPLGGIGSELRGGSFGAVVEVHAHPVDNLHRRRVAAVSDFLTYVTPMSVCGVELPTLAPAAHLALQAIHLGAGHRYQKLVLYRDMAQLVGALDLAVIDGLGAAPYLAVVLDMLESFGVDAARASSPTPRGGVLHQPLIAALRSSDPSTWDEYRATVLNALATVNSQTVMGGARHALSAVPSLLGRTLRPDPASRVTVRGKLRRVA